MVVAVLALTAAACTSDRGRGPGRQGSWQRVNGPGVTAGMSYGIGGLMAHGVPGRSGRRRHPLVRGPGRLPGRGLVVDRRQPEGAGELDHGDARESVASAAARRPRLGVIVGTVTAPLGDEDAGI